jgi:hypothetical protein
MSFDYTTINEDNYQQIRDFINTNVSKFALLKKRKNEEQTVEHLKKYKIKAGTKFTYELERDGKRYIFYLEVKEIKKVRAICNGIAIYPDPGVIRALDVAITSIVPEE